MRRLAVGIDLDPDGVVHLNERELHGTNTTATDATVVLAKKDRLFR